MVGLVLLLLALVGLVELTVIVVVAQAIGVIPTMALLVAVSVFGAWLVKRQGLGLWRRAQMGVQAGRSPADDAIDGAVVLAAGTLLVVPGFVTDLVGLVLLAPPVRRLVGRRLVRRWRSSPVAAGFGGGARVVDVEFVGDVTPQPGSRSNRPELGGPT